MVTNEDELGQLRMVATEYFEIIEKSASLSRRQFLESVQRLVADLYRLALSLPQVKPDTADGPQDRITNEQWRAIYNQLDRTLGEANIYWLVLDPADPKDHDAIAHTLSDGLADIYRDLKNCVPDGLEAFDNDALWNLRFSFETHWGQHAVSALAAIHALLHGPHSIID
jgi:hypothetical protein